MDTLMQDVRYALRLWRRRPGFAVVAIVTLALGIGANTAMFSIVNAVLLRPLPYPHADRLVSLWGKTTAYPRGLMSYDEYEEIRKQTGTFESSVVVRESGKYAVSAKHVATPNLGADSTVRKSWTVSFPKLNRGECSDVVGAFKGHLAKMGYVSGGGKCFTARLGREVLAYRKVNDMDRTKKAGPGILQKVFADQGGYQVKYPDAGEHVEAPLAKQVLVLIKDGKPFAIYPISSGKSSTPTVTGHFEFIRQEPGYNSHGMYYSFYFYGGYAVHGYESVPDYPASHGCLRTFIADQPEIYNRIFFGEDIFIW